MESHWIKYFKMNEVLKRLWGKTIYILEYRTFSLFLFAESKQAGYHHHIGAGHYTTQERRHRAKMGETAETLRKVNINKILSAGKWNCLVIKELSRLVYGVWYVLSCLCFVYWCQECNVRVLPFDCLHPVLWVSVSQRIRRTLLHYSSLQHRIFQ